MTRSGRYVVVEGILHGLTGYTSHGCRCPVCRKATFVHSCCEHCEIDKDIHAPHTEGCPND